MSKEIEIVKDDSNINKSFGKFLKTVKKGKVKTAGHMAEGDDSQGGHLVPTQHAKNILGYATEQSIVRSRAQIFPMDSDTLTVPRLVDSDRSSNMFGGITFRWEKEQHNFATAISNPEVGSLKFVSKKLIGLTWASNELERDAESFGKFMSFSFGRAMAFVQDYHFLWGNGAGQPLGIHNSIALETVARAAAGYIDLADFGSLAERVVCDSWLDPGLVWIINSDCLGEFFGLTAPAANGAAIINLNDPKILGKPLIISSLGQTMGQQGDLSLFNLSYYAIADRNLSISASPHQDIDGRGFQTGETLWKIVWRGDGSPIVQTPITPKIGSNQISPFVTLTTAS